jgi:hypothetical protein
LICNKSGKPLKKIFHRLVSLFIVNWIGKLFETSILPDFDPRSPMNKKLKEIVMQMAGGEQI